jgi:dissimilatory sulfite reductase related protein
MAEYVSRIFDGKDVLFDAEGFLVNPADWTDKMATELALESGLPVLTDLHWKTVRFLRTFYLSNGRAPLNRDIKRETGLNILELERLFPGGIRHGARRMAGLPNPKTC